MISTLSPLGDNPSFVMLGLALASAAGAADPRHKAAQGRG